MYSENPCCCAFGVSGEEDEGTVEPHWVTKSTYGQGKTISGGAKWFGPGPENRLRLMLDSDEHTLEFQLLKEDKSFWKIKLPESTKGLTYFPYVSTADMETSARFVDWGCCC